MVKPIIIKMEKLPNLENIELIYTIDTKAEKYLSSLQYSLQWKIRKIKGVVSFSHSGLSCWIDNLYVESETNSHVHEVYIYDAYIEDEKHSIPIALGDWYVDGEEMGIILIPKYIMSRIRSIVETYIKSNDINDREFSIELKQCRILAPGDWY